MSRFPRFAVVAIGILAALFFALPASADRAAEGRAFLEKTVHEFLAILRAESVTPEQRLAQVEALAIERFNLDRMTKLVLGKNRRKLSEAQQIEFRDEFKEHIALTYGSNLESFSDETIEIGKARVEKNSDVTVQTKVIGGAADGVLITYRLHSKNGAPWRVIDVVIEGVSTIQNFRSQIQDIVSNKGVEQLIAILREKNQKTATANHAEAQ